MLTADDGRTTAARAADKPRVSSPLAAWWMMWRPRGRGVEVMTVPCPGGRALALFGHQEEAELYLWSLGDGGRDAGWQIRESRRGEVVSVLCGACANVERVVLDPLPEMVADGTAALASTDRSRFVANLLATAGMALGPCAQRTPRARRFSYSGRGD